MNHEDTVSLDSPGRSIYAVELVEEEPGPSGARDRLIRGIAAAVSIAIRVWGRKLRPAAAAITRAAAQDATALTVSAVTGKLAAASLEGEIKKAEIAERYANARKANAEARKANAEARKADAEAAQVEERTARERVQRAIEAVEILGAEVRFTLLPDGRPCFTLGDGLTETESQDIAFDPDAGLLN